MTKEQLEKALVKADKAGDTKAARVIAQELKAMNKPTPEQVEMASPINRAATGAIDPLVGVAQGAANAIASPVGEALKQEPGMSNLPFVGGLIGVANQIPGGVANVVNAGVNEGEKKYEEARQAVGNTGIDWARAGGNMATMGVGGAILGPVGAAENALTAGATSLLTPTRTDQGSSYAGQKATQAATGVVASGVLSGLGALAKTSKDKFITILREAGVKTTPGQNLGGIARSVEDKSTSIPLLGDAINSSRKRGLDELNRAAYKYALEPIGENVDDMPVGREAIAAIGDKLGRAYDEVLPLVKFQPDATFAGDLSTLARSAAALPPDQQSVYRSIMKDFVLPKVRTLTDGQAMKEAEEVLGKQAASYGSSSMPADRQLASLFREVRSSIRENLIRSNPRMADRIKAIDEGWKAYDVIARAGSGAKAAEGFTPHALSSAVSSANKSYRKRAVSRGEAFMQDLSDAASARMPSVYPDSGTAGRIAMGAVAAGGLGYGGAAISPAIPITAAAASLPYLPGGRGVASYLTKDGILGVNQAAKAARAINPYAGGATPMLSRLLKHNNAPESD